MAVTCGAKPRRQQRAVKARRVVSKRIFWTMELLGLISHEQVAFFQRFGMVKGARRVGRSYGTAFNERQDRDALKRPSVCRVILLSA